MTEKLLRTSDLARAVGIHPNTVRLYVDWGLLPPVERSKSGYRLFTQHHLDCLRLARTIYTAEYPGRDLRASGNEVIQCAVADDWQGALEKAHELLSAVKAELKRANFAADLLEHWAQNPQTGPDEEPLAIREVSKLIGVSHDVIRNWERNGLVRIRRNSYNNYRLFDKREVERLQVIRMLSHAGYSHMAILRMFIELDKGNTRNLKKVLDTPRGDEDIFTAADHWLTTLHGQEGLAKKIIKMILEIIKAGRSKK
jgi:DNA-binding transcriptional MerR regulator